MPDKEIAVIGETQESLFEKRKEQLQIAVTVSSKITKESGVEVVYETRRVLQKARIDITDTGKMLREGALALQKRVIATEKELLAIISPEEERLKAIEDEFKKEDLKKERLAILPSRKEKLLSINGEDFWASDNEILEMDDMRFSVFFNSCKEQDLDNKKQAFEKEQEEKRLEDERIANLKRQEEENARRDEQAKLDAERLELDAEKFKLQKEKEEIEREKEASRLNEEAEKRAIENLKLQREREEVAKKAEEERLAQVKLAEEKAQRDSISYQNFLKECGMTKDNMSEFHKIDTPTETKLYKLVGVLKK